MSPPPKRASERDARFFTGLENGHPVGKAARAADYAPASVYRWRAQDPAFAARWAEAALMAADLLEGEADARGRDGVARPVFHRGKRIAHKQSYSDGLLLARLKALRPAQYRDPAPPVPPALQTFVIREFELEAELVRLVAEGKLTLDDLAPGPRATVESARAQMRDVRQ